ncbi:hypothetical protein OEZ85_004849 [Tetradesmus obliquus]|uniref:Uncharacterized protein n=1 Tax=Tetradesmus obliquus TaxID=3088 RepID=A0ABY8UIG1_TETOB|nr:hypothetical protein OEZ85_004849 [Tetradesmus obliquus]
MSSAQRLALIQDLAVAELAKRGVLEDRIRGLALTAFIEDACGGIRTVAVDVRTGCIIEEEPSCRAAAATTAPHTPPPPTAAATTATAAAAAAAAAAVAEEQADMDLDTEGDLPEQPSLSGAAAEAEDGEAAAAGQPAEVELGAAVPAQPDSAPLVFVKEVGSRSYACTLKAHFRADKQHQKKPWQVFIQSQDTKAAAQRDRRCCRSQEYLCMVVEEGLALLQAELQGVKSWADVQRRLAPLAFNGKNVVSGNVLRRLAGIRAKGQRA